MSRRTGMGSEMRRLALSPKRSPGWAWRPTKKTMGRGLPGRVGMGSKRRRWSGDRGRVFDVHDAGDG